MADKRRSESAALLVFPSYPTVGLRLRYVVWYVLILAGLGNVGGAIIGGFIVALLQILTAYSARADRTWCRRR